MAIVTLINDWKQDALYLAQINGALISIDEQLRIIDLTPQLDSFDEITASFILKNSFKKFPKGTIHLNFISHYKKNSPDFIIAEYQEQFFVSRNNGFLSNFFEDKPDKIYKIEIGKATFAELELYPIIVLAILKNSINKIAENFEDFERTAIFKPVINENNIIIHITYIDAFGNLITNLDKNIFDQTIGNKKFKIFVGGRKNFIDKINDNYEDLELGNLFAIFNSINLLEVGIKSGNLATLMSIQKSNELFIEIIKEKSPEPGSIF